MITNPNYTNNRRNNRNYNRDHRPNTDYGHRNGKQQGTGRKDNGPDDKWQLYLEILLAIVRIGVEHWPSRRQ